MPRDTRARSATHLALACGAALLAGACRAHAPAPVPVPVAAPAAECCADAVPPDVPALVAERYRVGAIATRRFTQAELWSALGPVERTSRLRVTQIGRSVEGRPIRAFTFGAGPVTVLLWSQMHGDESTATMALADLLAWFGDSPARPLDASDHVDGARDHLAAALTVVMVPMLNPDGAVRTRRENAAGVDVNRDARRLASPEARALQALHDSLRPAFGFNLHDQNARVLTAPGGRQVAIALLAPPTSAARGFGATRAAARLVAAEIASTLAREIPGRVARYDDTYNAQAFGDLMQQRGTSTVLIESGALPDDPEKQRLRTLNVVAILSALDAIADGRYRDADPNAYDALPRNGPAAMDVLVRGGTLLTPGAAPARVNLALEYDDPVAKRRPRIRAVGDLADVVALDTIDVTGLFLHPDPTMLGDPGVAHGLRTDAPARLTVRRTRSASGAVVRTIGDAERRATPAADVPPPSRR